MRRDVVVVGAGPAGALAAREVARLGASVLLLDRADFPRRKVCGACLSRGALDVLTSVGLGELAEGLGARRLRRFVVSAGSRTARLPLEGGRALSRSALDAALVRAAVAEGVDFRSGAKATLDPVGPHWRLVRVRCDDGETVVRAGVVLDATGLGAGLGAGSAQPKVAAGSRVGLGATYLDADHPVQAGELHMVVGRTGYVGLVRVEDGALNVAAAVDPDALRSSGPDALVGELLASAGMEPLPGVPEGPWRGTPLLTRMSPDVGAERLLSVGDAAGYVEPFTGEGMCWALAGARAVAPLALAAAERWDEALLETWRDYHGIALRRARRLCRVLVPALRRPRLVAGALTALGVLPGLAAPFVRRAARVPEPLPAAPR